MLKYFGIGVGAMFLIGGVVILGNLITTAASAATAPGRVIQKTLEANHMISSYERFKDLNTAFEARAAQVRDFSKIYIEEKDPSEKVRLRIELNAMRQSCREIAAKYNADAAKMNKAIFRADAPESLSPTVCEA